MFRFMVYGTGLFLYAYDYGNFKDGCETVSLIILINNCTELYALFVSFRAKRGPGRTMRYILN
jgi:hypothetical protein